VIPVLNHWDDTAECLASLLATDYPNLQIVVVDNGSTDGTLTALATHFPTVHRVTATDQPGFAAPCNRGATYALQQGADFVFIMNNDTSVDPAIFSELVKAALTNPEAAILGPRIWRYYDRRHLWFAGSHFPGQLYFVLTGPSRIGRKYDRLEAVDAVTGCGMLVRRSDWEQLHGFDEGYIMYHEDIDLCLRAAAAGRRVLYVPTAQMWHKGSVSTDGGRQPLKQYYQIKGSIRLYRRHSRGLWLLLNLTFKAAHAAWTLIEHLWRGSLRGETVRVYLRGLREAMATDASTDRFRST